MLPITCSSPGHASLHIGCKCLFFPHSRCWNGSHPLWLTGFSLYLLRRWFASTLPLVVYEPISPWPPSLHETFATRNQILPFVLWWKLLAHWPFLTLLGYSFQSVQFEVSNHDGTRHMVCNIALRCSELFLMYLSMNSGSSSTNHTSLFQGYTIATTIPPVGPRRVYPSRGRNAVALRIGTSVSVRLDFFILEHARLVDNDALKCARCYGTIWCQQGCQTVRTNDNLGVGIGQCCHFGIGQDVNFPIL